LAHLTRSRRDEQFWSVVKDLHWKLDDGSGGSPPEGGGPEFYRGGGGGVSPRWATHVIAFLAGGLTWGSMLRLPIRVSAVVATVFVGYVVIAIVRRWR
jgi:hypothetical protein